MTGATWNELHGRCKDARAVIPDPVTRSKLAEAAGVRVLPGSPPIPGGSIVRGLHEHIDHSHAGQVQGLAGGGRPPCTATELDYHRSVGAEFEFFLVPPVAGWLARWSGRLRDLDFAFLVFAFAFSDSSRTL